MTRVWQSGEDDFQPAIKAGSMPAWTPFCREHRRECSNGGCSAGARKRRHWALRGPQRRERTPCRRSATVVILSGQRDARCNRLPVGGCGTPPAKDRRIRGRRPNATHGDQPAGIWSGVTLIPPALTVARNGFGPRNCPKPSPLGAVYVSSAASGRPTGNEIPGISTRVTGWVTFRVTSVRIMGGTEGRSSWRCKGGTR